MPNADKAIQGLVVAPRVVKLNTRSGTEVRRTIPNKTLRMVGAWCFIDQFGPASGKDAMSVAKHPHTGLQTATWLFEGGVEHRDSVQSKQKIRPGELNLMTAGWGVSHSELALTPLRNEPATLSGVQMWIALPNSVRNEAAEFHNYSELPKKSVAGVQVCTFVGSFLEMTSPAKVHTALVGVELKFLEANEFQFTAENSFEYGFLVIDGEVTVNGLDLKSGELGFFRPGTDTFSITNATGTVMLLGGVPFDEEIVMWWNFIGRTHEEIVEMKTDWELGTSRFGEFADAIGGRIPAPEMPTVKLKPYRP